MPRGMHWPVAAQFDPDYVAVERPPPDLAVLTEEAVLGEGLEAQALHVVGCGATLTAQQRSACKQTRSKSLLFCFL